MKQSPSQLAPPSPLLFSTRILPEAFSSLFPDIGSQESESAWQRFAEEVDDSLSWRPDDVPQPRIIAEESLPLEQRGLTSHPPEVSKKRTHKISQSELWKQQTIHKFTVVAKLRSVGMAEEATTLEDCHSYYTIAHCADCAKVRKFPNRCDLFYCPECAAHLQNERSRQVEWWTVRCPQPKHVVLTIRNIPDLSPGHVDELRDMFSRLRRRKFARNWKGGFYTIQITYSAKGWHLHIHALVNARWIDEDKLKEEWRSITNGLGYIVRVKDCREKSYLREITRYVVHGSQLAAWQPAVLKTFVKAFKHKRTFGVFGELYGARSEFAEWIASLKLARPRCECGSCNVRYYSESQWLMFDLKPDLPASSRPPPPDCEQQLLFGSEYASPR